MARFRLGIWTGPFPVGDMDWPLSNWEYGPSRFRLGIWTGPFLVGDRDWPLSGCGYKPGPFQLGMWTGPFLVGDMDRALLLFSFISLVVSLIHFKCIGDQNVAHFSTHWHTRNF